MTLSEFCERLMRGDSVKCNAPQQRNKLVEFIRDELGFQIGPRTLNYIKQHPDGDEYTFVEIYSANGVKVVSLSINAIGSVIPFNKVLPLIMAANTKLDTRTDEEFWEAFAVLMS